MTPEQRSALESVAGRMLTADEVAAIDPLLPVAVRNDVQIAAILTAGQPPVRTTIRVEDVFDILYGTGDYVALKQAQMDGDALAVMAFAFLSDAKTLGPGRVDLDASATVAQFDALQQAGLLSQGGRAALNAKGWEPGSPVSVATVSEALNNG